MAGRGSTVNGKPGGAAAGAVGLSSAVISLYEKSTLNPANRAPGASVVIASPPPPTAATTATATAAPTKAASTAAAAKSNSPAASHPKSFSASVSVSGSASISSIAGNASGASVSGNGGAGNPPAGAGGDGLIFDYFHQQKPPNATATALSPAARVTAENLDREFDKLDAGRKLTQLKAYANTLRALCGRYSALLVTCQQNRSQVNGTISATSDKLRRCMLFAKVKVLQEVSHIQNCLFENQDDMCRTNIIVIKEKLAATQAAIDDLTSHGTVRVEKGFFASTRDLCALNPRFTDLLNVRAGLEARLAQARKEYTLVSKQLKKEDTVDRSARIRRVIDEMSASYDGDMNGKYHPARLQEFEFARLLLDQRTKDGATLNRWFDTLEAKSAAAASAASPPATAAAAAAVSGSKPNSGKSAAAAVAANPHLLTHKQISATIQHFQRTFANENRIPLASAEFCAVLIQRTIFPRIWAVVRDLPEASNCAASDVRFEQQIEWLRTVSPRKLGIESHYWMIASKNPCYPFEPTGNTESESAAAATATATATAAESSIANPLLLTYYAEQQQQSLAQRNTAAAAAAAAAAKERDEDLSLLGSSPSPSLLSPSMMSIAGGGLGVSVTGGGGGSFLSQASSPVLNGLRPSASATSLLMLAANDDTASLQSGRTSGNGSTNDPFHRSPSIGHSAGAGGSGSGSPSPQRRPPQHPNRTPNSTTALPPPHLGASGGGGSTPVTPTVPTPAAASAATTPNTSAIVVPPAAAADEDDDDDADAVRAARQILGRNASEDEADTTARENAPPACGTPVDGAPPLELGGTPKATQSSLLLSSSPDRRNGSFLPPAPVLHHQPQPQPQQSSRHPQSVSAGSSVSSSIGSGSSIASSAGTTPGSSPDDTTTRSGGSTPLLSVPQPVRAVSAPTANSNASASPMTGTNSGSRPPSVVSSPVGIGAAVAAAAAAAHSSPSSTGTTISNTAASPASSRTATRSIRTQSYGANAPPRPYSAAIDILEDLVQLVVPLDMYQCLLACSQSIYKTARLYADDHRAASLVTSRLPVTDPNYAPEITAGELGADNFFPIWLYVIIHSRLPDLHRRLLIMTAYSGSDAMSEKGYYLTCLEGAVHFIMTATNSSFKEPQPKKKK